MSTKISGKGEVRQQFYDAVSKLAGDDNNKTLAGRPILVSGLAKGRTIRGERAIQEAYRNSVFCPCLRGDEPPQKRIFDVVLGGCIPVVLEYPSREPGIPSHFEADSHSIRLTYPFAKGVFFGEPEMGIDWSELVISINGTACGIDCLLPTLEDLLLNHLDKVREKQRAVARYARLISYGMEQNGLQYADAVAAVLVQARHYIATVEEANAVPHDTHALKIGYLLGVTHF